MVRKLLICPWFGSLPSWMPLWERNVARLQAHGYDVLRVHDLAWFKERVDDVLGVDCPVVEGGGKVHDYRHAFGALFAAELAGYDFWGHTDFDMAYGRVERFVTDEFLDGLDLHSNHVDYVSGPWTLYRNAPRMNDLFASYPHWREVLEDPATHGWGETEYTALVDALHASGEIRRAYTNWQTRNLNDFSTCRFEGERLLEGDEEVVMLHFRRVKVYPASVAESAPW